MLLDSFQRQVQLERAAALNRYVGLLYVRFSISLPTALVDIRAHEMIFYLAAIRCGFNRWMQRVGKTFLLVFRS